MSRELAWASGLALAAAVWPMDRVALGAESGSISSARRVTVAISTCANVSEEKIRELVALELGATVGPEPNESSTQASITCTDASAKIVVDDPLTDKSLSRTVTLVGRKGRERLLAIATSELVFASWLELSAKPEKDAPDVTAATEPIAMKEARVAARELVVQRNAPDRRESSSLKANEVTAHGTVGGLTNLGAPLFGFGGSWLHHTKSSVSLAFGADFEMASLDAPQGSVNVSNATVLGAAFYRIGSRNLHARFGGGARVGYARLSGTPTDISVQGESLGAFLGGPSALAGASLKLNSFVIDVSGEIGGYLSSLRGIGEGYEVRTRGLHGSTSLGIGYAF